MLGGRPFRSQSAGLRAAPACRNLLSELAQFVGRLGLLECRGELLPGEKALRLNGAGGQLSDHPNRLCRTAGKLLRIEGGVAAYFEPHPQRQMQSDHRLNPKCLFDISDEIYRVL